MRKRKMRKEKKKDAKWDVYFKRGSFLLFQNSKYDFKGFLI